MSNVQEPYQLDAKELQWIDGIMRSIIETKATPVDIWVAGCRQLNMIVPQLALTNGIDRTLSLLDEWKEQLQFRRDGYVAMTDALKSMVSLKQDLASMPEVKEPDRG